MKFNVRNEVFNITFVNNYAREQYGLLSELSLDLVNLADDIKEASEELNSGNITMKDMREKLREFEKQRKSIRVEITGLREEILKELLESNDYEFDKHWWTRKTGVEDVNDFVLQCMQMDVKSGVTSKKK